MKPLDIIITVALAAAFIFALRYSLTHKSCGGDCSRCGRACKKREE